MSDHEKPRPNYKPSKRRILDQVAAHAGIRRDIVEKVLEGFYEVLAERILNEGSVSLPNLFSLRLGKASAGLRKEPHLQIRMRASKKLKQLLRKVEANPGLTIDATNWRQQLRELDSSPQKGIDLKDFLADDGEEY